MTDDVRYFPAEVGESVGYYDPTGEAGMRETVNQLVRQTLIRLDAAFEIVGLPEDIPQKWVKQILYTTGYGIFGSPSGSDKQYFTACGLGGNRDAYRQPDTLIITNPYIPWIENIPVKNDRGIFLISNDPLRMGLLPTIRRYCSAITDAWITMNMINVNSRCPVIVTSTEGSIVESARTFFKRLREGVLGIISTPKFDSSLKSTPYADSGKETARDAIEVLQYLDANLWRELGIQSNWNTKREALHSNEVDMDRGILLPLIDSMERSWQDGFDVVNDYYGYDIRVKRSSAWAEVENDAGGGEYDDTEADFSGMADGSKPGIDQRDSAVESGS